MSSYQIETGIHNLEFSNYGDDSIDIGTFFSCLINVMKVSEKILDKKVHIVILQNNTNIKLREEKEDTTYIYIILDGRCYQNNLSRYSDLVWTNVNNQNLLLSKDMGKKINIYKALSDLKHDLPDGANLENKNKFFKDLYGLLERYSITDISKDLLTIDDHYLPDYIYNLPKKNVHPIAKILGNCNTETSVENLKALITLILIRGNTNKYIPYEDFDRTKYSETVNKYIDLFNALVE